MLALYKFMLFRIVIRNTVVQLSAGQPHSLGSQFLYKYPVYDHSRDQDLRIFQRNIQRNRDFLRRVAYYPLVLFHKGIKAYCAVFFHTRFILKELIHKGISHKDDIIYFSVFQMKLFKPEDLIMYQFLHHLFIMGSFLLYRLKYLPYTKASQHKTLRSQQGVFIKKRDLHISSAHFNNSSSLLDHFCKGFFFCGHRFISEKTLLRIAEYLYPDTCLLINLLQNDPDVFRLLQRTGSTGPVALYMVSFHYMRKIFKDMAKLTGRVKSNLSLSISIPSDFKSLTYLVYLSDPYPG